MVGKGKIAEIAELVELNKIDLVLFNHSLSPAQERNIEKDIKCRVLDRSGLILDIFASRARTFEGKLQVELAQLEHISSRLIRGWTHLERQKGGIGLRGPGETQLEEDRRQIKVKIKNIQNRLEKVKNQRRLNRQARDKSQINTVAMVGYTNSGKSTLFKAITEEETTYIADQLFATLDLTLRVTQVPKVGKIIVADTVGFVRDLPHELIKAFHATLEETTDADLLLHVIDVSDELWREKKIEVEKVIHQIGAEHVPLLEVYNKIDLIENVAPSLERDFNNIPTRIYLSALKQDGLSLLRTALGDKLCNDIVTGTVIISPQNGKIRAELYNIGAVEQEIILEDGSIEIRISLQQERWNKICATFDVLKKLLVSDDLVGDINDME